MPYILQENREHFDTVIEALHDGNLYNDEIIAILFSYAEEHIKPSYNNYKNYCGELRQCATEIERRVGGMEIDISRVKSVQVHVTKGRLESVADKVKFMGEADIKVNGDLNYVLYGYAVRHVKPQFRPYFSQQLRLAAKKVTQEILAPYEDTKIAENGDVL